MNKLKKALIILLFLITNSCGKKNQKPEENSNPQPKKQDSNQSGNILNPNNCNAIIISEKQTDCFYPLPSIKNSEFFIGHFKDTLNIHTNGITIGQGKWLCQKGTWYDVYRSPCLTCLPGHSLEHCQAELERLIRKNI